MWERGTSTNAYSWVLSASTREVTYIFPDLVVKLVENDLIIRGVVVPENTLSLWARRVHLCRYRKADGAREGGGRLGGRIEWQDII